MAQRFSGRTAIVTGGSSGIGAAIVSRLASEGARVVNADVSAPATAVEGAVFQRTDVRSAADLEDAVAKVIADFGGLDVLVNNAGVGILAETPDLSDEDWERVFAINSTSVLRACRAAVRAMRDRGGGAIVNVASVSGLAGDYGFTAYNASKAAVINYTRSLALDGARHGIRANVVCPGAIGATAMGVGAHGSAEDRQAWLDAIPLGRLGSAEEVASVVAFLASSEAAYVTGATVVVDGGVMAHTGLPNVAAQVRRRRDPA